MMTGIKRALSSLLVCAVMLTLTIPAFAAGEFSVKVQGSSVSFLQDGAVVGTYPASSTDVILTSDRTGELLVQFPNKQGTYTNITLGQQSAVSFSGSMRSLKMSSALRTDTFVEIEEGSKVTDMTIYGMNDVNIKGAVSVVDVYGGATISVPEAGAVTRARLRTSAAAITAVGTVSNVEKVTGAAATGVGIAKTSSILRTDSDKYAYSKSGLRVDYSDTSERSSSKSSTSTTSSGLSIKASTIYAQYGDLLEELEGDLSSAVRVFNRSGNRIYGDLTWVADESTKVRDTNYYRFSFWPDDTRYDEVIGRVKVELDDDYDYDDDYTDRRSVYFDIEEINAFETDDLRLRDLIGDLESNVVAYSRTNDDTLDGTFKWVSPSSRVRTTGYHQFSFTPDNTRYKKTTGRIRVYVD